MEILLHLYIMYMWYMSGMCKGIQYLYEVYSLCGLNKILHLYAGPPGRTIVFQNVPSGLYSLRVTATSDMEEEEVIWKVYVPVTSSICSVNLINTGLVVDGTSVSMEFQGVGSTAGFSCRLDNGRFSSCEL